MTNLFSLVTDAKKGLIGVGLIIQPVQGSVPILDKGMYTIGIHYCSVTIGLNVSKTS